MESITARGAWNNRRLSRRSTITSLPRVGRLTRSAGSSLAMSCSRRRWPGERPWVSKKRKSVLLLFLRWIVRRACLRGAACHDRVGNGSRAQVLSPRRLHQGHSRRGGRRARPGLSLRVRKRQPRSKSSIVWPKAARILTDSPPAFISSHRGTHSNSKLRLS